MKKETSPQDKIMTTTAAITNLLLYKNERYGNAALNPPNIFSNLTAEESIQIRLDDKLKRIKNSDKLRKNDIADLLGYLILLCISNDWNDFSEFMD